MYAHRCVLFVYGPCADVTPLCGGSGNGSRLGKARQVSKPIRKYRHRKNVTLEGWDGVNPADMEPTEYDLNYEDPDLYDFIAD